MLTHIVSRKPETVTYNEIKNGQYFVWELGCEVMQIHSKSDLNGAININSGMYCNAGCFYSMYIILEPVADVWEFKIV